MLHANSECPDQHAHLQPFLFISIWNWLSQACCGIVELSGPGCSTSSLRVILLTVLAGSIHNILKFFAEKM